MLDFVDANQQTSNADLPTEFEFMMPILSPHESFRELDGTATSPADELFYRGQLLPLLLPCRLKMVQELYDFETERGIFSSDDADLLCKNASCSKGHPVSLSNMLANHEEHTLSTQKHRPNAIGVAVSKPRLRWKFLFRRGKKCSLIEAACCHFIRSKCTFTSEEALKLEPRDIETCGSSLLRSGSCKGDSTPSPKIVRRASSSLSSMHRNPSKNSRTSRDKVWHCATNLMTPTRPQKESLVLKVRDCLQRSVKALKIGRFVEKGHQQRASLLRQHDYGSTQNMTPSSVTKNRRQVAHCDSSSNNCFRFECEDAYGDLHKQPNKAMNLKEENYLDYFTEVNDEEELSSAAFITIEPSPLMPENLCNSPRDFECNTFCLHPPSKWDSLNDSFSATNTELQNSIQGAIAHCKGSM